MKLDTWFYISISLGTLGLLGCFVCLAVKTCSNHPKVMITNTPANGTPETTQVSSSAGSNVLANMTWHSITRDKKTGLLIDEEGHFYDDDCKPMSLEQLAKILNDQFDQIIKKASQREPQSFKPNVTNTPSNPDAPELNLLFGDGKNVRITGGVWGPLEPEPQKPSDARLRQIPPSP